MSAIGSRLRRLEGGQAQPPSPERWPYSRGCVFMAQTTAGTADSDIDEAFRTAGCTGADLRIVFVSPSRHAGPVVVQRRESLVG
jgi:hypothetical protein